MFLSHANEIMTIMTPKMQRGRQSPITWSRQEFTLQISNQTREQTIARRQPQIQIHEPSLYYKQALELSIKSMFL